MEGEARPGPFGPRAPASPDPGPESPWATERGVARWVAPRHTRIPCSYADHCLPAQPGPATLVPHPVSLPQGADAHWLPGLWVPAGLSKWEMPVTDQGEEGETGWLPSCWVPGGGRAPPRPKATAPVWHPLPQPPLSLGSVTAPSWPQGSSQVFHRPLPSIPPQRERAPASTWVRTAVTKSNKGDINSNNNCHPLQGAYHVPGHII